MRRKSRKRTARLVTPAAAWAVPRRHGPPVAVDLAIVCAVALAWGSLWLAGQWAESAIAADARFQQAFAAIDCTPPPGQSRTDFLDDVQYLSLLPDRISLLDRELRQRLSHAFALHPDVETVESITIETSGRIRVELRYRSNAGTTRVR